MNRQLPTLWRALTAVFFLMSLCFWFAGCAPSAAPTQESETKTMMELPKTEITAPEGKEIATFAGGCFWCTEAIFLELKGVEKVVSGYSGGHVVNPSYEEVCGKHTGHAEAIQITFDPNVISYKELLEIFFTTHDPTTLNRQGADIGPQYRSAVFYHSETQRQAAQEVIKEFEAKRIWDNRIVTEVTEFSNFYRAEAYHQDYFRLNPGAGYCRVVIAPKVAKFREKFREKLKR
jgi:peptide-methionine (S)-S-oxide reductase